MCGSASGQGGRLLLLLPGPIHGPDARRQGITGNVVFFFTFRGAWFVLPKLLVRSIDSSPSPDSSVQKRKKEKWARHASATSRVSAT
jgi:hypothetical protein